MEKLDLLETKISQTVRKLSELSSRCNALEKSNEELIEEIETLRGTNRDLTKQIDQLEVEKETRANEDGSKEKIIKRQKSSRKILLDNIESGVKSGEFIKNDPEKIANIFQHMVFPYILFLIGSPSKELSVKEETDLILDIFFNGILINNNQRKR